MLDDYKDKQPLFYNYAKRIITSNMINHAYLIETNNVNYGFDIALALAKAFLCPKNYTNFKKCQVCNICMNIDEGNYPDIKIIDNDNREIKKEQMLDLKQSFNTKPLYGKHLVYIIKHANLLNKSSANTILKFLEEPADDIVAILLTDNIYNCLETIVSRCQILNLKNNENKMNISLFEKYCPETLELKDYILQETEKILFFYQKLENQNLKLLLDDSIYDYKEKVGLLLQVGLYLYMDVLNSNLGLNVNYFDSYKELRKQIRFE